MARECAYELYVAVYEAVRLGLAAGDPQIVHRVSRFMEGRPGAISLAMVLALIDARHGDPVRAREEFCTDVLCDCPPTCGLITLKEQLCPKTFSFAATSARLIPRSPN